MIHLIGAGGHAKVVLDALLESGTSLSGVTVRADAPAPDLLGLPVATPAIWAPLSGLSFHVAIGDAAARERLFGEAERAGGTALSAVHPTASISRYAKVAEGSFIAAAAVVGPSAMIGRGVIVNHGAVVDHDCVVGDFTHVAPNASLGGGVSVGVRCLIGAGAVVLPGVTLGDDVTIGAGAVVTRDVTSAQTWTGVPAAPKAS